MKPVTPQRILRSLRGATLCSFALLLHGCANVERSRDWSNDHVSGEVLVQQVCSTCHGIKGESANSLFPKLAGQQKAYIQGQLESIRGRDRNSERTRQFMWGPARSLTNEQIEQIATYFSSQPAMRTSAAGADSNERGKTLYYQGLPSAGVEACASCHGDAAQGDDVVPRLAGQHQSYMDSRARIAMTSNVAHLSDEDISAISAYVASIGEGGVAPARLKPSSEPLATVKDVPDPVAPAVFDANGDAKNCSYSVWTYGWYCGKFFDALVYHLKRQ
jgi:cytochrome c553